MDAAKRFASFCPPRRFAALVLLTGLFLVSLGLFYRSLLQTDIIVTPANGTEGAASLMQQLDNLDVDYRLRRDGTLQIDSVDADMLVQAGMPDAGTKRESDRVTQATSAAFTLFFGILALIYWRKTIRRQKRSVRVIQHTASPSTETPVHSEIPEHTPVQPIVESGARYSAKLFESEHPQTVAVYLLGLDASEAASDLEAMPERLRERVWKRMACSGDCDPVLRRRVAELFMAKRKRLQRQLRPSEVTEKMTAIFRRLSAETRSELLSVLRREDAGDEIIALLEA